MAAETRGRRPQWNDYKKFRQAVDEYFDKCKGTDEFPDYAGMLLYLQIDKDTAAAMCADGAPDAAEFQRIYNFAAMRRESWLARHMVADNKKATGCMNALKQMENGGYQDKNIQKSDSVLRIKVDGLKGGLESMK
jgi:hypothetical protein